jgi:hypothetical protein
MMDKFAAVPSDLQRASALAAFKLIADSNLIGGVNGGRQHGQRALISASQKRLAL